MAHMTCGCGNDLWDGDGHIVYDVYKKSDLKKYSEKIWKDIFDDEKIYEKNFPYLWICDKCKKIHLWTYEPKYCYRKYILKKDIKNILINNIEKMDEYFAININDYDLIDNMYIKDYMNKNPNRPYKYYADAKLNYIYIVNTNSKKIDRVYELTYESFVKYKVKIDSFKDIIIYTVNKRNKAKEYNVEKGKRIEVNINNYPYIEVHFMITKNDKNGGTIKSPDNTKEPEIYNASTINEFQKKYGKYYCTKKESHTK